MGDSYLKKHRTAYPEMDARLKWNEYIFETPEKPIQKWTRSLKNNGVLVY